MTSQRPVLAMLASTAPQTTNARPVRALRRARALRSVAIAAMLAWTGCATPRADDASSSRAAEASAGPVTSAPVGSAPDAAAPDAVAPAAPPPAAPFPGVRLVRGAGPVRVEVDAIACLDAGWLEQVACMPGTREHESLVVVRAQPSHVHAALLMAGFEPGRPGAWRLEGERVVFEAPRGTPIEVRVRHDRPDGTTVEESVRRWIRDAGTDGTLPDDPWLFCGSVLLETPDGALYAADASGSVVGLVTFGDEIVGYARVWADEEAVETLAWEVRTEAVPPPGTRVVLILEDARSE